MLQRLLSRLSALFRCAACDARETENAFLRSELVSIREESARVQRECLDRVMARSYTEYAVGRASIEGDPNSVMGRSDEVEWALEQERHREVEAAASRAMRSEGEEVVA